MKTKLIFLKHNNYFNKIKKLTTAVTYSEWKELNPESLEIGITEYRNFYANDNLTTTIVINNYMDLHPNYVLLAEEETLGLASVLNIISSWFIINSIQNRNGQWSITLRRDVINDFYDSIGEAPIFVEKGILPDNDPFIFNSEKINVNQIKKEERLLKDKSGVGYIIGYVARTQSEETDKVISSKANIKYDYTLQTFPYIDNYGSQGFFIPINDYYNIITCVDYDTPNGPMEGYYDIKINLKNQELETKFNEVNKNYKILEPYITTGYTPRQYNNIISDSYINNYESLVSEFYNFSVDTASDNEILNTNQKIIYDTENNKYYKIRIMRQSSGTKVELVDNNTNLGNIIFNSYNTARISINELGNNFGIFTNEQVISAISYEAQKYIMEFIPVEEGEQSVTISTGRRQLVDAPYDMFAIPYGEINVVTSDGEISTNILSAMNIAQAIAEAGVNTWLYDLQLLPYFPLQNLIMEDGRINLVGLTEGLDYSLVGTEEKTNTVLFWCSESNFTFNVDYSYFVKEPKIEDICDMWRLCSPNYQGVFEFSMAKNKGCSFMNIDATYKPLNPYIKVNPSFGGLYGSDFNDARGLICGGDFSVPTTSDAFKQYEVLNKNYQNIFDRQIENMETRRKYELINQSASAITKTAQGSAMGSVAGGVPGAVIGGVSSGIGGIADIAIGEALYRENKSYQTDLYNFNLQNISARPDSLVKSGAFTINNKIFPFVEKYSCTDEEREAVKNKIKYNGMTVGRIDIVNNFVSQGEYNFLQGEIIRLENLREDSHIANAIYEEFKKGVFI